jgi:hypothetical protein
MMSYAPMPRPFDLNGPAESLLDELEEASSRVDNAFNAAQASAWKKRRDQVRREILKRMS